MEEEDKERAEKDRVKKILEEREAEKVRIEQEEAEAKRKEIEEKRRLKEEKKQKKAELKTAIQIKNVAPVEDQ